ncbi:MAG: four helix bundle protein [Candidatus Margulisbacteria bacterium]|nr:four helix bundle protein [Candidatus Margulisiibacteriota bacterium]
MIEGVGTGGRGFQKLIVWQNAYKLRLLVYTITERFPKIEIRRVSQMRDAARSIKQNIQEGYGKGSIKKYINYLAISHDSALEVIGDIQDCFDDRLISAGEFKMLDSLSGKTIYLLKRLIQSLRRKEKEGTWVNYYDQGLQGSQGAERSSRVREHREIKE